MRKILPILSVIAIPLVGCLCLSFGLTLVYECIRHDFVDGPIKHRNRMNQLRPGTTYLDRKADAAKISFYDAATTYWKRASQRPNWLGADIYTLEIANSESLSAEYRRRFFEHHGMTYEAFVEIDQSTQWTDLEQGVSK